MNTKKKTLETVCFASLTMCGVEPGMHILAAVSGGADSVALLLLLHALQASMGITLSVAHFDHQLRGEASREDARFVKSLCTQLGVECRVGTGDVRALARRQKRGLEDAARQMRYAFLYETADAMQADVIALAHHVDDQAETVLLHATRGCDIRGLCAMRLRSGRLIRPLLCVEKSQLEAYVADKGQSYRLDESNLTDGADRNKIRHGVLTQLKKINPQISAALSRLSLSAQRDEAYFGELLDGLALDDFHTMPYGGYFSVNRLEQLPDAILSRALYRYWNMAGAQPPSSLDIEKAIQLIHCGEGSAQTGCGMRLIRGRRRLHFVWAHDIALKAPAVDVVVNVNGITKAGEWTLLSRTARPGETGDGIRTQVLDLDALAGARLRTPSCADVFTPLGMRGTQKVKKTLSDMGVESLLRPYVPVVAVENRVLWIVGARPAQTAAITPQTRRGVHFTFLGTLPFLEV